MTNDQVFAEIRSMIHGAINDGLLVDGVIEPMPLVRLIGFLYESKVDLDYRLEVLRPYVLAHVKSIKYQDTSDYMNYGEKVIGSEFAHLIGHVNITMRDLMINKMVSNTFTNLESGIDPIKAVHYDCNQSQTTGVEEFVSWLKSMHERQLFPFEDSDITIRMGYYNEHLDSNRFLDLVSYTRANLFGITKCKSLTLKFNRNQLYLTEAIKKELARRAADEGYHLPEEDMGNDYKQIRDAFWLLAHHFNGKWSIDEHYVYLKINR